MIPHFMSERALRSQTCLDFDVFRVFSATEAHAEQGVGQELGPGGNLSRPLPEVFGAGHRQGEEIGRVRLQQALDALIHARHAYCSPRQNAAPV